MSKNCQLVVFSNKAYNAIIRESFDKDPVETGGILLGHILDNGVWIVMEVLPPGINSIFEHAYFEYDDDFVNYLAQSVANQYKYPLDLLGLWHRHPGSMDVFSSTDDGTNSTFARQNPKGVISGLVNIDPSFRLKMYHLDQANIAFGNRPAYSVVNIEVGDDIIPNEYFQLRYYDGDGCDLHPFLPRECHTLGGSAHSDLTTSGLEESELGTSTQEPSLSTNNTLKQHYPGHNKTPNAVNSFFCYWHNLRMKWLIILLTILALIICTKSFRTGFESLENIVKKITAIWKSGHSVGQAAANKKFEVKPLTVGSSYRITKPKIVEYNSQDTIHVTVNKDTITPKSPGETTIIGFDRNNNPHMFKLTILEKQTATSTDSIVENAEASDQ